MTPQSSNGFTGTVNLQLSDLIQMVCLSRSDLVISVSSSLGMGRIHVKEGVIHQAEAGELSGENAFFRIFSWKDGQFEILPFEPADSPRIEKTWEYLLLEAVRRADETDGGGSKDEEEDSLTPSLDLLDEIDHVFAGLLTEPSTMAAGSSGSTEERPRRVLIVDDSSFFAKQLRRMLDDPRIEIVGVAANGKQAIDILDSGTAVDLVTMDIQMPVMPGDTALKHIMIRHHVPVLIVSAVSPEGWGEIADFLNLGAVDFLPKPESRSDLERYASNLRETVLRASQASAARFKRRRKALAPAPEQAGPAATQDVLVLIGGEGAYVDWLRLPLNRLCATRTTILIQHLPHSYLPGFCSYLTREALVEAIPLGGGAAIGPGVLHVGAATVPFEAERSTEAGLVMGTGPSAADERSWEEGLQGWLEGLAQCVRERLSVCLFSSARTMPSELADTLLGCHARILLATPEELMCRQLVESVQPYMYIDPDRVFSFDTAHILEVL